MPIFLNLVSKAEQGYFLAGLYRPELPTGKDPLTVTAFLKALGACWLLDRPFPVDEYDFSPVAKAVGSAGCDAIWEYVIGQLAEGCSVRQLAAGSTELGVLQLRLATAEH